MCILLLQSNVVITGKCIQKSLKLYSIYTQTQPLSPVNMRWKIVCAVKEVCLCKSGSVALPGQAQGRVLMDLRF